MDVKTAVSLAKQQISELFAEEGIKNLNLAEVDYDEADRAWRFTIGFSRPWDEPRNAFAALANQNAYSRRAYKVVRIADDTTTVLSVRNLEEKDEVSSPARGRVDQIGLHPADETHSGMDDA